MLLRKRPRPPMRRTTSMTEFAAEVEGPVTADQVGAENQSRHPHLLQKQRNQRRAAEATLWRSGGARGRRRNSGNFAVVETASFLMACGLCKRRLGPGRDTFMYRYFLRSIRGSLPQKIHLFGGFSRCLDEETLRSLHACSFIASIREFSPRIFVKIPTF